MYGGLLASKAHNSNIVVIITGINLFLLRLYTFDASEPLEAARKAHNYSYADLIITIKPQNDT